jgi:folylpolyglutamate synthase/dihydropteroate synthase
VVTGITALGIDHVSVLGRTLREIAWQKGGIFKVSNPSVIPHKTTFNDLDRRVFQQLLSLNHKKEWKCLKNERRSYM